MALRQILILGATRTGVELAQVALQNGFRVKLIDHSVDSIFRARQSINTGLRNHIRSKFVYLDDMRDETVGLKECLERLECVESLQTQAESIDVAIETLRDSLRLKQDVIEEMAAKCNDHTLLISHTCCLRAKDISEKLDAKERFCGAHFHSPVTQSQLVELVKIPQTSIETLNSVSKFCESMNNKIVQFSEDVPGFLVNRILTPTMQLAQSMAEKHSYLAENPERINDAYKAATGAHIGPLELAQLLDPASVDVIAHDIAS